MIRKILIFILVLPIFTVSVFPFELGLIGGTINNPTETIYGVSFGSGFIVPLLKFEIEYYNLSKRKYEAVTVGVKLRKRFKKFAPYGILGVGSEFDNLTFNPDKHKEFFFVGGGLHYHIGGFFSLRADIRFQNFKKKNKTRLSLGVFFHL